METNDPALLELETRIRSIPGESTPEATAVAAENLSAAGLDPTPAELAAVQARYKAEGRSRVRAAMDRIDNHPKNKGTPRTRLPWEESK